MRPPAVSEFVCRVGGLLDFDPPPPLQRPRITVCRADTKSATLTNISTFSEGDVRTPVSCLSKTSTQIGKESMRHNSRVRGHADNALSSALVGCFEGVSPCARSADHGCDGRHRRRTFVGTTRLPVSLDLQPSFWAQNGGSSSAASPGVPSPARPIPW